MSNTEKPNDQKDESTIEIEIEFDDDAAKAFSEAVIDGATTLHSFLGVLQGALKGAETSAKKSADTEGLAPFFKDAADNIKQARAHIRSEIKSAQQASSPKAGKKEPAQP